MLQKISLHEEIVIFKFYDDLWNLGFCNKSLNFKTKNIFAKKLHFCFFVVVFLKKRTHHKKLQLYTFPI